jgi:hypothetical protein
MTVGVDDFESVSHFQTPSLDGNRLARRDVNATDK